MPLVFSCIIEGTTGFEPQSWNQFYSSKYHPFAEIIVESAIEVNSTSINVKNNISGADLIGKCYGF